MPLWCGGNVCTFRLNRFSSHTVLLFLHFFTEYFINVTFFKNTENDSEFACKHCFTGGVTEIKSMHPQ